MKIDPILEDFLHLDINRIIEIIINQSYSLFGINLIDVLFGINNY